MFAYGRDTVELTLNLTLNEWQIIVRVFDECTHRDACVLLRVTLDEAVRFVGDGNVLFVLGRAGPGD